MFKEITKFIYRPKLYEHSTNKFWDDEHISKGMLQEHLNSDSDLSTRKPDFVKKSVDWISEEFPPEKYNKLLDLGCGPGIYAELFHKKGYKVTGVDLSPRSINYAIDSAKKNNFDIAYKCEDYLKMNSKEKFDIITLIWCDFGVLTPEDRKLLLSKMYEMLSPGSMLILDVFSDKVLKKLIESKTYEYFPNGGFWSGNSHLCLNVLYLYDNTTALRQYIIATEEKVECYNLWEHCFEKVEITEEFENAKFKNIKIYGDLTGNVYSEKSETICVVAKK